MEETTKALLKVKDELTELHNLENGVYGSLKTLVKLVQGNKPYIQFNDYTAYPTFEDIEEGFEGVVGLRVKNNILQINTTTELDNVEEWFSPLSYGHLDIDSAITCIEEILRGE